MTLDMRCEIIKACFGKYLCRAALSNIYKRNGVSNLKPSYKWHLGKVTENEYVTRKMNKIRELMDYMQAGKSIVYIDETSTHLWEKRSKIWMPRNDPIYLRLQQERGYSRTIIGAICSDFSLMQFQVVDKTTKVNV
jgi:hypothetical protein